MSDVIYEIFPAIGIARVGNAPDAFYIGPEQAGGLPILPDEPATPFSASDFRDSEGRLRRQAARSPPKRRNSSPLLSPTLRSARTAFAHSKIALETLRHE